ncbi:MAG: crosslink repair DNA glycosylase YcaQ family protein [Candidatus Limnocylindrales bacterium]
MPDPPSIDRATARRFLVRRHLLAPPRALAATPESVRAVVTRLGSLQFDPLEVTGRNHDLVLAARIAGYRRAWTDGLLYGERWLFEAYNKGLSLVPTAELPYYRLRWDLQRVEHATGAFQVHAGLVEELLERITREGPLSSTDFEPRAAIDWYWRPTNQVRAILEALAEAGILALARREGNRRIYDLTERLFPADLLAERRTEDEQRRHKLLSRYRAHGLLGLRGGQGEVWLGTGPTAADRYRHRDALIADGELVPVRVEGVRGDRLVLAQEVPIVEAAAASTGTAETTGSGVAFLAPLDPLVWDREMLRSLFDFDYVWEVYVPAARRRWGYYVLPLLWGDRFVGRIEPRADRRAKALRVTDIWWEAGFDPLAEPGFVEAFVHALQAHARFLDATRVLWPRLARHRALGAAVRARLGPGGRISERPAASE